jgi:Holliday junction DNA helicase RuvA
VISSVRGTVLSALGSTAVIEVGGVGLSIQVTPEHALSMRTGSEAFVHTTLIVREDSLSLFGFETAEQLAVFELLTSVTGVGPKSALGVLAVLTPDQIARAVSSEDDAVFRKVSGIGPKTAKLIVVALTGKLRITASTSSSSRAVAAQPVDESVLVALIGLGWSEKIAQRAVEDAVENNPEADVSSVPALLRLALAQLGPAANSAAGRAR